jgi:hypothetical protein
MHRFRGLAGEGAAQDGSRLKRKERGFRHALCFALKLVMAGQRARFAGAARPGHQTE